MNSINQTIDNLARQTEYAGNCKRQVQRAFLLGLWHKSFPDYMLENLTGMWGLQLPKEFNPNPEAHYWDSAWHYPNLTGFTFIADTGDSWHQCYRDLRQLGWRRQKVHRDGGLLQYLFQLKDQWSTSDTGKPQLDRPLHIYHNQPEGFRELWLLLTVSISTCKQVQVGTETKEVPIMKTVCEDLKELNDDEAENSPAILAEPQPFELPPIELTGTLDPASEPRCEHGKLSGLCFHSDCPHYSEDDIPF